MTTLLLLRHGQSTANEEGIFAGFLNAPLTEKGRLQAACTASFIAENYKVDAVYASDLARAYDTGCAAAQLLGLPVTGCEELREIFAGKWEGCSFEELYHHGENFPVWLEDIGNCRCPEGESVEQLSRRIYETVCRIAQSHDGQTVLIATHATPIRTLMCRMAGLEISGMKDVPWVTNASVTEVRFEKGVLTPVKISQDAHLAALVTKLPVNV